MDQGERLPKEEFVERFKLRTKRLALDVIRFSQSLPRTEEAAIMKRQLLRSATSVAANYRAACRARSAAEFYAKLSICVEEADETLFWLELLTESGSIPLSSAQTLLSETTEILSILAKARKNTSK
ncbi:four helix bundle protein [Rufibacter glacialis]|uniref:Four helix bundle protein n=1 Tax=Rufibacter glacialis TaxID=1259555 RepID=A0A5M8Q7S1_9BACT|nr:four helix bundle protein [Rufibacter glacialis]KAA6431131.1 four helix bundle protein [Rufibacter glacialis]GGK84267.1 four helix bundle protein [Rufibacter glacialis]